MNRRLWLGLLLALLAVLSYGFFFYRFPITRDVPWVSYILFAVALWLLVSGFRRSARKVWAGVVAVVGVGIITLFIFGTTIGSRVPLSPSAPQVGQKAPDFTLLDSTRQPVSLSQLLASSPRGVLLVFYRGYW
jgi:thiol:disulfide interchange protein